MTSLIIPNTYVQIMDAPLIFLAGPIRGAPNWQDEAVTILNSQRRELYIASPRRGIRGSIANYIMQGEEDYFPRQRTWEKHYLNIAARRGTIMFWLPGEEEHRCEKVYGAMTRLELGQCMTEYRHDNSFKFCVGSDGKFPELDTIAYDLSLDAPDKVIFGTLEETCAEALRMIN